jgi:SAM-dependent methyltransferase
MKLLSKVIVGTTCVTIFCGTAYVAAITLAPPPNYTVSNNDRLKSYDVLSVNNLYEKKTKSQEFYLGLSRWRRKMLRDEGLLRGRVLEVGAGCGGNYAYYPHSYFTDDPEVQKHMKGCWKSDKEKESAESGENATSYMLRHITKENPCDEIILCDRSTGMVQSCISKIQSRLGYTPYRYPDYNIATIRSTIEARMGSQQGTEATRTEAADKTALRKRKIVHEDGTVREVLVTPLSGNEEAEFLTATAEHADGSTKDVIVPILHNLDAGDKLPLLSKEDTVALAKREQEIRARQKFRLGIENQLRKDEKESLLRRGTVENSATDAATATDTSHTLAIPSELLDEHHNLQKQPLFAVANYAAEQLPFPDNSFDTVVDMFGLCSFDDPVRALRELSRVCKPGGKLLLIEHGKGYTARINNHLDKWAPRHAKNWGCWWNRDIRRVIRLSGLSVEKWESKHFGTSHYIIAKPFKSMEEWDTYELQRRQELKKAAV